MQGLINVTTSSRPVGDWINGFPLYYIGPQIKRYISRVQATSLCKHMHVFSRHANITRPEDDDYTHLKTSYVTEQADFVIYLNT